MGDIKVVQQTTKAQQKGDLTAVFSNAHENKIPTKIDLQNLEAASLMGDINLNSPNLLSNGMRSVLGLTSAKIEQIKKRREGKYIDIVEFLIREAIQKSLEQLQEIIAFHQQRIEEILENINQTNRLLEEFDHKQEILQEQLEYYQNNGFFELDENGQLKNKEAEAILSGWEEKTGKIIDRSDPAAYEAILQITVDIEENRIRLQHELKIYTEQFEYHKNKRDEAIKIKENLQNNNSSTIQSALVDVEDFYNGYEEEPRIEKNAATDVFLQKDELLKDLEGNFAEGADKYSFDFPPLKKDFIETTSNTKGNDKLIETPKIQIGKNNFAP